MNCQQLMGLKHPGPSTGPEVGGPGSAQRRPQAALEVTERPGAWLGREPGWALWAPATASSDGDPARDLSLR